MSHVVSIQSKVQDPAAVAAACQRLGLNPPTVGKAKLYSGEASGLIVQLPDWLYPIVIDPSTGVIQYDNYHEVWGAQQHLDRFLQMYAVERAKLEARKQGYPVSEKTLQDGYIKVQIIEGS